MRLAAAMKEDELLRNVHDMAKAYRCRFYHPLPAEVWERGRRRWHTPLMGDAGWPDVVIVGNKGILFRELKQQRGNPSPAQWKWIETLIRGGGNAAIWRPEHWYSGRIEREIRAIK
jgi:hypothetical protein